MLPYAAFTLIAIVWLIYRLALFLSIPVWRIVSTLGLQVPHTTRVSIDEVTSDTITIRWENEPSEVEKDTPSISRYILYLNNVKVGTFPNIGTSLYTCCSLKDLLPHTQYQLDFVCVNQDGFMNKVPSTYVMTKNAASSSSDSVPFLTVDDAESNPLTAQNFPADMKWRKTQVVVSTDSPTSYASLTSLQDLDDYSINDLKNILVCAQEDLHEVLQQQASVFQDFRESEIQLRLELDNLKAQWAHEIDLRKSLKSSIKSLENSKLLYDLKKGKLDKNINQSRNKINKMKNDIVKWDQERAPHLRQDLLKQKFSNEKSSLIERIDKVSCQIRELHAQLTSQEEENKKLNSVKKSLDSTKPVATTAHVPAASASTSKRNSPVDSMSVPPPNLASVIKKINDYTNEKTGMLTSPGHEFLNALSENSQLVSVIKEEIRKDVDLENQWRARRSKLAKRNDLLEKMWADISINNQKLRDSLAAQPYTSPPASASNAVPAPQLTLHDPATYSTNEGLHEPSTFGSGSFHASPPPPPPPHSVPYNNWDINQERRQPIEYNGEDQNFDYDDSHHLLSGLQNMISEADYQATNVSTSKLYTTDQLDNYWSRQNVSEAAAHMGQSSPLAQPSHMPLLSPAFVYEVQGISPSGPMLRTDSFAPMSVPNDEEVPGLIPAQVVQRDEVASFGSGFNNDPVMRTSPLSLPLKEEFTKDNLFSSGHYNNIWGAPQGKETPISSPLGETGTPKALHSRSSSHGSWGLPQFMHKSPNSNKTDSKAENSQSSTDNKDKETTHSNGRRISRLLSKSGMNHLFRSPTHESSHSNA
ncbi:Gta1p [Lachancea thermotolerans CBS 6340]|uniref:KLTH0C03234p n=1 Tax=Lachancea thermotolerans (strain ATCC 56472 / CBS 6340 / NRRL Y-8284) TaxID=559295 RepID=C5DDR7_LACTC|nr:KLTH0C03234p [Lachancea thermotolerans CBS 6340]CAR21928.1 KLTH0C03234p [Lachancea thermotolerans CBS 6340]